MDDGAPRARGWAVALSFVVVACGAPRGEGPDAGALADAGFDAGDGGDARDGGPLDAGPPDCGVPLTSGEAACVDAGWARALVPVDGTSRSLLWRGPSGPWSQGAILVLHGGGGRASDFCSGGALVQPQLAFAARAVERGFAVFALDSTDGRVTDAMGRACGKRFDFSVLPRPNLDLPFIRDVGTRLVPALRPAGSSDRRFLTGLSTGGYMTVRAATAFDDWVTAFAPVSAGDPYGTDTLCDPALSPRDSAVGILVDRETRLEITTDDACVSTGGYPNEAPWDTSSPAVKPAFRHFHHASDGIVDASCMRKSNAQLLAKGYAGTGPALVPAGTMKSALLHLWLNVYNEPLLDYFDGFTP